VRISTSTAAEPRDDPPASQLLWRFATPHCPGVADLDKRSFQRPDFDVLSIPGIGRKRSSYLRLLFLFHGTCADPDFPVRPGFSGRADPSAMAADQALWF
jgi:hypothetical protein